MKKIFLAIIALLLMGGAMAQNSRQAITDSQVPATAKNFIKKYWLEANIFRASKSKVDVEVTLDNATTIQFDVRGNWKQIRAYDQIPTDMLPNDLVAYLNQFYPDALLLQANKDNSGYRIRLDNELVLKFNPKGKFIKLI